MIDVTISSSRLDLSIRHRRRYLSLERHIAREFHINGRRRRLSSQISRLERSFRGSPGRISRIYVFPRTVDAPCRHSRREPAASGFFIKAQPRLPLGPTCRGLIPERPSIILKPAVIKLDGQFHRKTPNAAIVRAGRARR